MRRRSKVVLLKGNVAGKRCDEFRFENASFELRLHARFRAAIWHRVLSLVYMTQARQNTYYSLVLFEELGLRKRTLKSFMKMMLYSIKDPKRQFQK